MSLHHIYGSDCIHVSSASLFLVASFSFFYYLVAFSQDFHTFAEELERYWMELVLGRFVPCQIAVVDKLFSDHLLFYGVNSDVASVRTSEMNLRVKYVIFPSRFGERTLIFSPSRCQSEI